jgi:cysteine desulfurase
MIYLDHAATTPVDPEVFEAMAPYLQGEYGNPSSFYGLARRARGALDEARERLAAFLGAAPREIVFTGCGSEADNLAIKGLAFAHADKGRHIITSSIEHHAVLHACRALEKYHGFEVTYLPVDHEGLVAVDQVAEAMRPDTILVTIMHSNNEVGTIQPIPEIGALCMERQVRLHTDAVQSVGKLPLNVNDLNVDLLAIAGHKFYAPKGVGALYMRKGVKLANLIDGGSQEFGRRAGTENVASIVGMGKAVELLEKRMEEDNARITRLRDRLLAGVLERIPQAQLTGHPTKRICNIASFCFHFIEGEGILLSLDLEDVCVSSGSACTSASLDPSHVLIAMGYPHEVAHGSIRMSLGRHNTEAEIDRVLDLLPPIVDRLRSMSPLWADARWKGEV